MLLENLTDATDEIFFFEVYRRNVDGNRERVTEATKLGYMTRSLLQDPFSQCMNDPGLFCNRMNSSGGMKPSCSCSHRSSASSPHGWPSLRADFRLEDQIKSALLSGRALIRQRDSSGGDYRD